MFTADEEAWINKRLTKDAYKAIAIVMHDAYESYLHHICKDNDDPYLEFSQFLKIYELSISNGRVSCRKRGV